MTRFLQVVHLGRPLDVLLILSLEQHVAEEEKMLSHLLYASNISMSFSHVS